MAIIDQDMVVKLITLAKNTTIYDEEEDPVIFDYVGSNVDDAFYLGERNGQTYLARDILTSLGVKWNE